MRIVELSIPFIALMVGCAVGCSSEDAGKSGTSTATGGGGGSGATGGGGGATGGAGGTGGEGGGGGVLQLRATIDTSLGIIEVDLEPTLTPITVANFQAYADAQFYDGLIFHRVIPDFMIQGGGLYPDMSEKDPLFPPIVNEAVSSGLSNLAGTIAMARTSAPNSATSQFYINTVDNTYLDPSAQNPAGYCVFGNVVRGGGGQPPLPKHREGMRVVAAIENVPTQSVGMYDDVPVTTVLINSITVAPL